MFWALRSTDLAYLSRTELLIDRYGSLESIDCRQEGPVTALREYLGDRGGRGLRVFLGADLVSMTSVKPMPQLDSDDERERAVAGFLGLDIRSTAVRVVSTPFQSLWVVMTMDRALRDELATLRASSMGRLRRTVSWAAAVLTAQLGDRAAPRLVLIGESSALTWMVSDGRRLASIGSSKRLSAAHLQAEAQRLSLQHGVASEHLISVTAPTGRAFGAATGDVGRGGLRAPFLRSAASPTNDSHAA